MIDQFISFIRRKVLRIDKYRWDHQYAIGRWDRNRTKEMQRLYAAKSFLNKYASGGNILEKGCGEGIFFQNTWDVNYHIYEGMEVSELAISRIPRTAKSLFQCGDMEKYIPLNSPFSVIVFNEVLYYSKGPIALLKRYSKYLAKDGVFLIGMNDIEKCIPMWDSISESFLELDAIRVEQDAMAWYCKTFKMK